MINQIHPAPQAKSKLEDLVKVVFNDPEYHEGPANNKIIEIITAPNPEGYSKQKNVAIIINPKLIQSILLKVYSQVLITEIITLECLNKLAQRKPDLVFSGVKYFEFGETQIWLNDFLNAQNISYIGSNHAALDRESDKSYAKSIMRQSGILTADAIIINKNSVSADKNLDIPYPVFVKPIKGGDSIGIDDMSIVYNLKQLNSKLKQIFNVNDCDALVETYLAGREFSVGIIEDEKTNLLTAMPIEIIAPKNKRGHRVLDYDIKRLDQEIVQKVSNKKLFDKLSRLGKSAFNALGGRSFGRIDIRLCAKGLPHFVEANLMPGLSKGYFYRSCLLNLGMTYDEMILLLCSNRLNS